MRVVSMCFQAPWVPIAAQIHVAVSLHERYLKGAQRVDVVVERCIRVPGGEEARAMRVEEYEGRREVGVVVDYVGEVGHGFSAFVHWGCEGSIRGVGRGVDGVDCCLPAVPTVSESTAGSGIEPGHTLANVLLPSPYSPFRFWP